MTSGNELELPALGNISSLAATTTTLTIDQQERLETLEAVIAKGLETFVEVGSALLEIRDQKLYRRWHRTFEEYCRERWGMARRTAYQLMDAAEVVENVRNCAQIPANEAQTRPLAHLEPDQRIIAWQTAVETAPNGKITAAHVEQTVEYLFGDKQPDASLKTNALGSYFVLEHGVKQCAKCHQLWAAPLDYCPYCHLSSEVRTFHATLENEKPKPHVAYNSGNQEWYTPVEYIESARLVMGEIDLDPASTLKANEIVRAKVIYTAKDDGLQQPWFGRMWINPPYALELVSRFAEKLAYHFSLGEVTEAIVLVNNATETSWFGRLAEIATALVFPRGRVRFWSPDGVISCPLQGQAIVYIGQKPEAFLNTFRAFGWGMYRDR